MYSKEDIAKLQVFEKSFKLFPLKVIEKVYELLTQIIHFQLTLSILEI